MSYRKFIVSFCAVATMVAAIVPATGHEQTRHTPRAFDRRVVLGPDVEDLGNGHFKLPLSDGKVVYTHGPDFPESHGFGLEPGDPERAPVCATDYYQHVLYARPLSLTSRYTSVKASIQGIVRRMNAMLNEESLESGNVTADYKVKCDSAGQIAVGEFANAKAPSFYDVINAAKAAGFNKSNVDYTILYDAAGPNGVCGIGTLYSDESLSSGNDNNTGGGFGVSYAGCWEGTPMHENGHNQGAVQKYAPNGTGSGGHCQDEQDIMCYADGGSRYTGLVYRCQDDLHFDCGHDDYFDSAPEAGEYLASHWNLGSRLNRFIQFGTTTPDPVPPPPTGDPDPSTPTLTNGVAKSDGSGSASTWKFYKISVPTGKTSFQVVLDGPACVGMLGCTPNLDLYIRRWYKPTTSTYRCASKSSTSSDEKCTVTYPAAVYWYIGVYVRTGSSGTPYTIKATYS